VDTCPKHDVILLSRKDFCALEVRLGLGLELKLGLGLILELRLNMFSVKRSFWQMS